MTGLIEDMRDRNQAPRLYVIATGAGADLLSTLWRVPGISRVLVGASLPYDKAVMVETLGYEPEQFVSKKTAIALAQTAYMKALISPTGRDQAVGIGITASVASLKEHRGEHRAEIAVMNDTRTYCRSITLPKATGGAARFADDAMICNATLDVLFQSLAMRPKTDVVVDAGVEAIENFFERPLFHANGPHLTRETAPMHGNLFFPGAFNPIHSGHTALAAEVLRMTGMAPILEITSDQLHKPMLAVQDALARVAAMPMNTNATNRVFVSRGAPLYIDKARRNPCSKFIIGVDALDRMLDPKWAGPTLDLLYEFVKLGTSFYVASRTVAKPGMATYVMTMEDVLHRRLGTSWWENWLHANYGTARYDGMRQVGVTGVFHEVKGKWDISSTQLRDLSINGMEVQRDKP